MTKQDILEHFKNINAMYNECTRYDDLSRMLDELQEPCEDAGEISDGYHTFNQLYHQRAILFATIVNQNKDIAWKSYKHSDGKYCFDSNGEWFIVGIDTPEGSYTYHYSKEYWNYFKCKELDCGKEWDGHTEEDVTRLLSLEPQLCEDAKKYFNIIRDLSQTCGLPYSFVDNEIKEVVKKLNTLPPVTPSEKVGHWKWVQYYCDPILGDWVCSECKSVAVEGVMKYNEEVKPTYKYCSQCGCKIQEVEE